MKEIEKLQQIIDKYDNIVFFGGAGVSTESGIPDFRSVDGLYNQQYDYPPETILSHTFFMRNPQEFPQICRKMEVEAEEQEEIIRNLEQSAKKARKVSGEDTDGLLEQFIRDYHRSTGF